MPGIRSAVPGTLYGACAASFRSVALRAACITPSDLAVSHDHRIYIGLYGGGVLVGHRGL